MPQTQPGSTPYWASIARLGPLVRPIVPRLLMGLVVALAASALALAVPQVLRLVIDDLAGSGTQPSAVWGAAGVVLLLGVLEASMIYLRRVLVIEPSITLERQMRVALYDHLQDLPVAFHDRWGSGQLLSRSIADLSFLRRWLAFGAIFLVVSVSTVALGVVLLFTLAWQLALIFLAAALPIMVYGAIFRRRFSRATRRSQDQAGDLATTVEESVHGIRVLKAFGRSREALEGFTEQAQQLRETEVAKSRHQAIFSLVVTLLPELALGVGLMVGLWLAATGQLSIGSLAAFFATAAAVAQPVEASGMLVGMALTAKTAVDRHFEVMDARSAITDPAAPRHLAQPRGALAFRDVRFAFNAPEAAAAPGPGRAAHDGARPPRTGSAPEPVPREVLRGVTLAIRPGETMALVGATGSGKSTLLQLVPRLYDVTGGAVEIDGVDIRQLPLAELRRLVAVAFEDTTLFSSSVRENVLLGAPVEDGPEAQSLLEEALDVAQAQFAHSLPDGLGTRIGEEGLSLSGGQRQRIALARAIAARPAVLVLDDPLSALDVATEERVSARLGEALARTTTLIVAHRPSTVALADRVALLRHGVVEDVGTHAELLERSEHYRWIIASLPEEPRDLDRDHEPDLDDVLSEEAG
ncbi:ABC transporter ATP-binding protein [Sinomonas cellulolyticus]|uniref:ABC transporter ATP-binding protein n=1 Tax=Sinomonas cellulolyticus TaxID=2801916 RepID=A0ABS1K431_9MICC|nr:MULTISPECIES: ABC transporter ATP-binding protein [Sinomonas]MBL0705672.1 ABC transporter ATP-binding protein [Sinomonas cellulolyticus]